MKRIGILVILVSLLLLSAFCLLGYQMETSEVTVFDQFSGEAAHPMVQTVKNTGLTQSVSKMNLESTKFVAGYAVKAIDPKDKVVNVAKKNSEKTDANSKLLAANVKSALNIRKSSNTNSAIIGKLFKDNSAQIVEKKSGWYKIKSGSVTGWVSGDYVFTGSKAKSALDKVNAATAVVTANSLNMRSKNTTSSDALVVLKKGESFSVTGKDKSGKWIKIRYTENVEGYVSADYVKVQKEAGTAISMETFKKREAKLAEKAAEKKAKEQAAAAKSSTGSAAKSSTKNAAKSSAGNSQVTLLAALCQHEAGTNYNGCLAVANVVLNRVRSSSFPNTIEGVIYQKSQFSGVNSGALNRFLPNPNSTCVSAARAALAGSNNVGSRLYFRAARVAGKHSNAVNIGGNVFY